MAAVISTLSQQIMRLEDEVTELKPQVLHRLKDDADLILQYVLMCFEYQSGVS